MAKLNMHGVATEPRGRITARVPQSVTEVIERAANVVGATINQFVTQAAFGES